MSTDPHAPTPAGPDPDQETASVAGDPPTVAQPTVAPTPSVSYAAATPDRPAGTADPEGDWLAPDVSGAAATPEPDPAVRTPSAFTPLGTPGNEPPAAVAKAKELTERPEVMVGLALAGGVLASIVLKRLGA